MSDSGISWGICKSAPRSKQITMPAPHRSVFTGRMPFLPPNQQRQSTEGHKWTTQIHFKINNGNYSVRFFQHRLKFLQRDDLDLQMTMAQHIHNFIQAKYEKLATGRLCARVSLSMTNVAQNDFSLASLHTGSTWHIHVKFDSQGYRSMLRLYG